MAGVIHRMNKTDFERVMAIQWSAYRDPWSLEAIASRAKLDKLTLLVVESEVIGFATYYWFRGTLVCDRFAVSVALRRSGFGTQLLEAVEAKARRAKFVWILAEEYQLDGQLFLKSQGYRGFGRDGRYVFEKEIT